MSSGVTQKEIFVHVVNLPTEMSLPEMPKIRNRTVRNNDGKQVPESVGPTCRCHSFIKHFACPFHTHHLAGGAGPRGSQWWCAPCSAFFVSFHNELLLSLWRTGSIVACANLGLPSAGQNATVRFNIVSPVKSI